MPRLDRKNNTQLFNNMVFALDLSNCVKKMLLCI